MIQPYERLLLRHKADNLYYRYNLSFPNVYTYYEFIWILCNELTQYDYMIEFFDYLDEHNADMYESPERKKGVSNSLIHTNTTIN